MSKQFLLFAGDDYYPEGGAEDFIGSYDRLDDAIKAHDPNEYLVAGGWANVFDLEEEKIVKYFYRGVWYNEDEYFI